jgi:hypothetical protein
MNKLKNILIKNKLNLILLIILILILVFGIIANLNYYPVISVNNVPISAKKLNINMRAAIYYLNTYKKLQEERRLNQNTSASLKELSQGEIKLFVLNQLIENELIHQEAEKRIGSNLKDLVNEKINNYLNPELEIAALEIYGLNKNDFKNEILIPQAEKDILAGRLFLENKNIADWLKEQKKQAKVIVFDKKFKWNGENLELNK